MANRLNNMKRKLYKWIAIAFGVLVVYVIVVTNYHVSEGTRTGYLAKFEKEGLLFKTYEGEIYMSGAAAENSTLINNNWLFSAPSGDENVLSQLQELEGKVVKAYYYQVMHAFPWQGNRNEFVYKVEYVRD